MDDEFGFTDYPAFQPTDTSYVGTLDEAGATGGSGVVSDFFNAARTQFNQAVGGASSVLTTSPNLGNQLFDAIYQAARGKADQARTSLVSAFLRTNEGKKLQAEGTRQTLSQYAPFLVIGAVLLIVLGFFVKR